MKSFFSSPLRVLVTCLLVLALAFSCWKGIETYRVRRSEHLLKMSRDALARSDFTRAVFWAKSLAQKDPQNPGLLDLMVALASARQSPEEVFWRSLLAKREPGNVVNLFALVKLALASGNLNLAGEVLKRVPAATYATSAESHSLLAQWAFATQQLNQADSQFSEAARLDPGNPVHALNLNALRLASADSVSASKSRRELEQMAESPATRLIALPVLLADAMRCKDAVRTRDYREKLLALPQRDLEVDLLCLKASMGSASFQSDLAQLQAKVGSRSGDASKVASMARWMMSRSLAREAVQWLTTLPLSLRSSLPVQTALADAYASTGDWQGLKTFLADKNWQDQDFVRRAVLLHAKEQINHASIEPDWAALVNDRTLTSGDLMALAQMAKQWGWRDREDSTYWKVANRGFPLRPEALRMLWDLYMASKNTPGVLTVATAQLKDTPQDLGAQNNVAFLSLLLGIHSDTANRLAQEAWKASPLTPEVVATYGYSLIRSGRYAESIAAFQRLSRSDLRRPNVALYYATALLAAGRSEDAAIYAAFVTGVGVLPEERALIDSLKTGLGNKLGSGN